MTGTVPGAAAARGNVPGTAPLWRRLFDDAAIFPPGDAPFATAVPAYAARMGTALGGYVGPFIAPAGRWAEFRAALPATASSGTALSGMALSGDGPSGGESSGDGSSGDGSSGGGLALSATLGADRRALAALLDAVAAEPRVALRSVEIAPAGTAEDFADLLDALTRLLPAGVTGYLEVPVGPGFAEAAAAVHAAGHRIKIRTGGTVATAFPGAGVLADALATCVRLALPFKLTAGLHNALRHRDGHTGFEHHGFLNVLAALAAALDPAALDPAELDAVGPDGAGLVSAGPDAAGPEVRVLAGILDDTDPARIAARIARMPVERMHRVRGLFTSFGTCSIDEPLGDLRSLGLIKQETGA